MDFVIAATKAPVSSTKAPSVSGIWSGLKRNVESRPAAIASAVATAQQKEIDPKLNVQRKPIEERVKPCTTRRQLMRARWLVASKATDKKTRDHLSAVDRELENAIAVMKKDPDERTADDIDFLYKWTIVQDGVKYLFRNMREQTAKKVCRSMGHASYQPGEAILTEGDVGDCCYILMHGSVSVFIRPPAVKEALQKSKGKTNVNSLTGNRVATLTSGMIFGELCFLEPNGIRSASVIVDKKSLPVDLIVLDSILYSRILHDQRSQGTVADHIKFLRTLSMFKSWTKVQLLRLAASCKHMTFKPSQYIQRMGSEIEYFGIIFSGEAREMVPIMAEKKSEIGRQSDNKLHAELTFLSQYDIVGARLATSHKKLMSKVDIRAITTVEMLVLSRSCFNAHILNRTFNNYTRTTIQCLKEIDESRQAWRETRINQVKSFPDFHVPITRKMMRLSETPCTLCGRTSHVAGDGLCINYKRLSNTSKKSAEGHKGLPEEKDSETFRKTAVEDTTAGLNASRNETEATSQVKTYRHALLHECWEAAHKAGLSSKYEPRAKTAPSSSRRSNRVDLNRTITSIRSCWPYRLHEKDGAAEFFPSQL